MKRCYYEILEVDSKATASQIKNNYRKMALKYHPDKNQEEGAKQRFVQINEAYNVLSDVNQRSWYDQNREKILFNKEEMSKQDIQMYSFGFNVWNYFTVACFKGFEDNEGGFYQVYRDVFQKIKTEEAKSYAMRDDLEQQMRKFEGFGDSNTIEAKMLKFYEDWDSFSTYKTFVWSEQWDTRDANNRWMRREMEKQNKKQRQNQKKTYIKTVKDLSAFVKKRDPRYRDYLLRVKEEEEKKALEKLEKQKEKKKQKQEMKVIKQKLEEERFKEIEQYYQKQNQQLGKANQSNHFDENDQEHEFYCQICDKEFKSDNQLKNHEKSKQHKQMIKQIEKEVMLKEQKLKQVEEEQIVNEPQTKEQAQAPKKKKNKKKKNANGPNLNDKNDQAEEQIQIKAKQPIKQAPTKKQNQKKKDKSSSEQKQKPKTAKVESDQDDDETDFIALLNNRNAKAKVPVKQEINSNVAQKPSKKDRNKVKIEEKEQEESQQQNGEQQKIGKAKLKKQKKAQQQKNKPTGFKCHTCNEQFPSKTKLFEHINKTGHASAK